ncbi:MAG TPA: hypothetical protein VK453_25800 [Micromonosporaceae bacterium]|nr:hypothetical protein [Micromonosporaceae bacterium]
MTHPVVAATGHRRLPPDSLPWLKAELRRVAAKLRDEHGTTVGISGMALGADMEWADAVLAAGLDLHAYVPFEGQELLWPPKAQERWQNLIAKAAVVRVLADAPAGHREAVRLLHARNDAMLQASVAVVAVWSPDERAGGTFSAVKKATRRGLPVVHLDPVALVVHGPGCRCVATLAVQPALPGV